MLLSKVLFSVSQSVCLAAVILASMVMPGISIGQTAKPDVAPTNNLRGELTKQEQESIAYQKDLPGPVFLYDQSGGFKVMAPGKRVPDFQLFADGKVIIGGSQHDMPTIEFKLEQKEVDRFLNMVVNENRFFELNEKTIMDKMGGKPKVKLMDAPMTRFEINLKKGKKGIAIYALWNARKNYPNIPELEKLARVEAACKAFKIQAHLKDDGPAVLKLVNEELAKKDAAVTPFKLDEIASANRLKSGRFQVRFSRKLPTPKQVEDAKPTEMHALYFRSDAKSKPTVMFMGWPKK